ncbi:hypothetical protein MA16_Dca000238 [Dendrobium catenatum]|uniref:Uncharacterized protein n=1 Tax=Dendrobium catenatum TaxID=906689 RepID=A0A2I0WTA9_9ASPA|nr:hypothetical protein MA16_Dca000238 [Dendrobium catenatum]
MTFLHCLALFVSKRRLPGPLFPDRGVLDGFSCLSYIRSNCYCHPIFSLIDFHDYWKKSQGESVREHSKEDSYHWSVKASLGGQRVIRGNGLTEHVARVSGLVRNARIIQHVLRTSIIPKADDRVNITPLLSMVTFLIMSNKPIDEAQLILDYLYGLYEIVHAEQKRKRNITFGHLVSYVMQKKYNLVHPDQEYEEPLFYNDASFRAIFKEDKSKSHASDTEEEVEDVPAPANEPNYQNLVERFDRLETHFEAQFQQQQSDIGFMKEQMNEINTNVMLLSSYYNFFCGVPPPPPPSDQGP